jgi:CheY-like chemotaxis protein
MAGGSGWNDLSPTGDPRSASPFPPGSDESAESDAGRPLSKPLSVLLVEDNPTDVFVIKSVLEACGLDLDLRIASDGQDALQYFEDMARNSDCQRPALVLLDLNLPKVPGIEVLRHLRKESACAHLPVIVVTSSASESDRQAAASLGAEAYFQKSADLTTYLELAQVIRRVLASAKTE